MFVWATVVFFELYEPPGDAFEIYVVGKQWMWKLQHPGGRARDQRAARPAGPAGQADHDLAGRDPQLLRPGVPDQAGRAARAVHDALVPSRPRSGRYHLFCAEYCGTNHSGMIGLGRRDGAGRLSSDGCRQGGAGPSMAEEGERLFVQHHCAGCHRGSPTVQRPAARRASTATRCRSRRAATCASSRPTTRYIRDSILLPKSQVVAGYEPVMPIVPGADQRGGPAQDHRLHQVDRQEGEGRAMSADVAVESDGRLPDQPATALKSWLLTTDHKRIGAPVHGLDHVLLLRRRGGGDADAARADDARRATCSIARHVQPAVHACTA